MNELSILNTLLFPVIHPLPSNINTVTFEPQESEVDSVTSDSLKTTSKRKHSFPFEPNISYDSRYGTFTVRIVDGNKTRHGVYGIKTLEEAIIARTKLSNSLELKK